MSQGEHLLLRIGKLMLLGRILIENREEPMLLGKENREKTYVIRENTY